MVSKISCFIVFGIIIFTNGNLAYRQDSYHEKPQYDLKTLISELSKQDRQVTHHEEITCGGKPYSYSEETCNAESYQGVPGEPPSLQYLNLFLRNKPGTQKTKENNDDTKDCMKIWGICTELAWNFTDTKTSTRSNVGQGQEDDDTETRNNSANEDVLNLLNDLEKTLKLDGNNDIELRCYGNGCDVNKVDDNRNSDRDDSGDRDYNYNENYGRHLRCNGKRCSIDIDDDDSNYKENLRCYGNRCSRKTNDRDDDDNDVRINEGDFNKDINHILRSNRDDSDRNSIESFRCIGDRCSRNRNDDDRRDTLLCIGDRCSRDRDGGKDDRTRSRCVGDRCGRNTDDNERGIYCTGNRCGRSRSHNNKIFDLSEREKEYRMITTITKLFRIMQKKEEKALSKHLRDNYNVIRDGVLEIVDNYTRKS